MPETVFAVIDAVLKFTGNKHRRDASNDARSLIYAVGNAAVTKDATDNMGFTLLEMSIVLVIIAVVTGGGMAMFEASLQKQQLQETQTKLAAIQQALLNYSIANNRLPCPADVTRPLTDPYFGVEAGTVANGTWTPDAGACTTYGTSYTTGSGTSGSGVLGTTAANSVAADFVNRVAVSGTTVNNSVTVTVATTNINVGMGVSGTGIPAGDSVAATPTSTPASPAGTIKLTIPATAGATNPLTFGNNVEGLVPTNTLHLPDDYAIDGWGNRIMYTVDNRFTANNALAPYSSAIAMTGNTNNTATVSGLASTSNLAVGMFVYGSGIPSGDTILTIVNGTSITLTTTAANTLTAESLTFSTTTIPPTAILPTDTTPRITVLDQSDNTKTTQASYVLVSFGPNGHGSWPRGGTTNLSITSRTNSGSVNTDEGKNCDCSSAAVSNATIPAGVFVQKQPTLNTSNINDAFDDVVVFGAIAGQ